MNTVSITQEAAMGRFSSGDSVVLERVLPGTVEQVWRYLTEPSHLKLWLAGGTVDLRVGGKLKLDFDLIECPGRETVHGLLEGTITALDPPRLLTYTWGESGSRRNGDPDSVVSFALKPEGGETRLTLTHTRIQKKDLTGIGAGWHVHLDVLVDRLNGKAPGHFMDAWQVLEPRYRGLL
jgi:uncharacterized protein YndB with AHSA1/START domain